MQHRITPEIITHLALDEVFVYGANLKGTPGKGAAKTAQKWGTVYGPPGGRMGQTYGIPTKGHDLSVSLPLSAIDRHVQTFLAHAHDRPHDIFLVTEIGCGLADNTPQQIAPLFVGAVYLNNVHLPARFWAVLNT